uniref:Uncharacterized protein n=1 Tax=Nelumbo nucifera TaxID=4432 RepID=A0A822YIS8_NELNU|nr:TPA_asm: hypothetical protein HUJ06_011288 [Nelumbo nucifera]
MSLARIRRAISFKCIFFLILTIGVFFSYVLWIPPFNPLKSVVDAYVAPNLNGTYVCLLPLVLCLVVGAYFC